MVPRDEQDEAQGESGEVEAATDADPEDELAVEDSEAESEPVEEEVERLNAELDELRDRHLRLAAEFDNFRKRTVKERATQSERARADLVRKLLDPLDDLSRVTEVDPEAREPEAVVEGVRLVEQKMRRVLAELGLEPIEAVGTRFDPELHEALTVTPTGDPDEDGIVSQELTRGYLFHGTLLRPALVEVKKLAAESGDSGTDEGEGDS